MASDIEKFKEKMEGIKGFPVGLNNFDNLKNSIDNELKSVIGLKNELANQIETNISSAQKLMDEGGKASFPKDNPYYQSNQLLTGAINNSKLILSWSVQQLQLLGIERGKLYELLKFLMKENLEVQTIKADAERAKTITDQMIAFFKSELAALRESYANIRNEFETFKNDVNGKLSKRVEKSAQDELDSKQQRIDELESQLAPTTEEPEAEVEELKEETAEEETAEEEGELSRNAITILKEFDKDKSLSDIFHERILTPRLIDEAFRELKAKSRIIKRGNRWVKK